MPHFNTNLQPGLGSGGVRNNPAGSGYSGAPTVAGQGVWMTKVGFMSLGCPKNLVDSEVMLGHLRLKGFTLTPDPAQAEVLVVNTCG